ncbi:peptidoglycan-binding protein [Streptomyces sp. NPDC001231]|uniref:peptidoglycan-binding protein n=1 Tax=Streptomyces sp. NPDC001231 TaxID=3364549 RepID=UPI003677F037
MHSEDQGARDATQLAQVEALRVELVRVKEDKKLSLDAFAHDTQYSRSSWNRVLKGEGFPPREAIERLCARRRLNRDHFLRLWEEADDARRAQPAPTMQTQPDTVSSDEKAQPATDSTTPGTGADERAEAGPPTQGSSTAKSTPADEPAAATAPRPPAHAHAGPGDAALPQTEPVSPAAAPVPAVPPATTSVPPGHSPSAERPDAAVPAPATPAPTVGEEVVVVRPVTTEPRAGKKRKVPAKLVVLAGLVVVLVLGRWASMPDHKDAAVGPPPAASNRPIDAELPADTTPTPNDDKSDSGQSRTPAPGIGSPAPNASSAGATPSPGEQTVPGSSPSAEAPAPHTATPSPRASTTPTATSTVRLGAEGRENCNYNSDRAQTMAKGMVGSKVKQIQCFLNYNYDYALEVDGKFGSGTEAAVKAVQQCSGIKVDGQVGPETWKYLEYPMAGCGH